MAVVAVVEVEEGAMALTVAAVSSSIEIRAAARVAFREPTGAALSAALQSLREHLPPGLTGVHVAVGDRRLQHFVTKAPRLPHGELRGFVRRECRRRGSLTADAEVRAHARVLDRRMGRVLSLGVTAATAAVVEPVADACARSGLSLASLTSIETAIGAALDRETAARAAVLDCSAGKARFLLCERGAPTHVRRFLLHGADAAPADAAMLAAQLAMEVPRTLEYLKEQGAEPPQVLLVGPRVAVDDADLGLLQGDVPEVRRFDPGLAAGTEVPGLATIGLLRLLRRGRRPPSLTADIDLELPARPLQRLLPFAAVLVGAGAAVLAWQNVPAGLRLHAERAGVAEERARLEGELAQLAVAAPAGEAASPDQLRLLEILAQRRACSLALQRLCEAVPDGVLLDAIRFAGADRVVVVVVAGTAAGADRLQALTRLGAFAQRLESVPFLQRTGVERIEDAAPGVRFAFDLGWRRP
jgi:hypothetical protein